MLPLNLASGPAFSTVLAATTMPPPAVPATVPALFDVTEVPVVVSVVVNVGVFVATQEPATCRCRRPCDVAVLPVIDGVVRDDRAAVVDAAAVERRCVAAHRHPVERQVLDERRRTARARRHRRRR